MKRQEIKNKEQYTLVMEKAHRVDTQFILSKYNQYLVDNNLRDLLPTKETERIKDSFMFELPSAKLLRQMRYPDSIFKLSPEQLRNYHCKILNEFKHTSESLKTATKKLYDYRNFKVTHEISI